MPIVELTLLGPLRILVEGAERVIAARKQRVLIASLATRAQGRSRERVIADLWPESDDEHGRQSLRHALYEIHAAVGVDLIATSTDGLRIEEAVTVDVRAFERAIAAGTADDLARAFAVYGGDLCPEIEGVDGEADRVRLRGLFATAGETLAAHRLAADPRGALGLAQRVLEIDPYREEAHRTLLRALASTGDLAGAVVHYRRLTGLLRDELGVEVSSETRALFASLGQPARPPAKDVRRPSLEPPAELIGRRAEYSRLMGTVTRAIDGRGAAALLVGEGGTGKSRLVEEIATVADRHGVRVLRARATAAEGALPFQLWVDALTTSAAEATTLASPWPAVLATLLPDMTPGPLGSVAPEFRRTRLFEGVARLLAHLASASPTLVALDDLHHADPDSVQLFHYIARTSRQRRLAVIAAARPSVRPAALDETRASLEARGDLDVIELGALSPDAVGQLVHRFGVPADQTRWLAPRIATLTDGNPFFVFEVLRALAERGRLQHEAGGWVWSGAPPAEDEPLAADLPSTVRQTVLARVAALPDPTRRMLDLVAVLGAQVRIELVAAVAGRDELAVAEDLAPAIDAGLIREDRETPLAGLTFTHELVRDAAYQHIRLTVRAAMHRRAAAALERSGAPNRVIAHHLTAGGDAERGAARWIASAEEAGARFAHDDAIRSYGAALAALGPSSPRRALVLRSIGDAYVRRGSAAAGVAAYDEALAAPGVGADERAALCARIAGAARYYHRHPLALEYADAAVAHHRSLGHSHALAEALVALAWVRYVDGDATAAHDAADEARTMARLVGAARTEAQALHVTIWARWLAGDRAARVEPADAERLVEALGDDEAVAVLLGLTATALLRSGRSRDAVEPARQALGIARRVGSLRGQLEAGEELVTALRVTGAWREAVELADEVAADVAGLDLSAPPRLSGELAIALSLAGDHARAASIARELIAASASSTSPPVHGSPALDAVVALLVADTLPALDLIAAQRPSCATCQVQWHVVAGRLAALHGDVDAALGSADALEELTRLPGYRIHAGAVEHIRTLAFARMGRVEDRARAESSARAAYRGAERVDAEAFLDFDLGRISPAHV